MSDYFDRFQMILVS